VISAIDAIEGILAGLNQVQEKLGWSSIPFYFILTTALLIGGYFLLGYLFPLHAQKLKRKVQKLVERMQKKK